MRNKNLLITRTRLKKLSNVVSIVTLSFFSVFSAQAIPVYPGAMGAGTESIAGRGGNIIKVTNLNDAGPGSLRACVEAKGPRICVFTVGGVITLNSGLWITSPNLTVAGQTAPGGGILITSHPNIVISNLIGIMTHDILWSYIRIRNRWHSACSDGGASECGANLTIFGGYNIIADHISISWNQDEGIGIWRGSSTPLHDITMSNNFIAEGLASHPTGLIIGSDSSALDAELSNVDFHHNLTMTNGHRNPLMKNKSGRVINNIYYNQYFYINQFGGGGQFDSIGNYYKKGPLYSHFHEIQAFSGSGGGVVYGNPSLYISGNRGYNQSDEKGDQWVMANRVTNENGSEIGAIPLEWRRSTPLPSTTNPIVPEPVENIIGEKGSIVPTVGASRRLDCNGNWVANRDSVDARLVTQYLTNTGKSSIPVKESDGGGIPTIASGTACTDTDNDGMPDDWENANFKNLQQTAAGDADGNGYTNIEEYLNGTKATPTQPSVLLPPTNFELSLEVAN
jgi:pectate lyase